MAGRKNLSNYLGDAMTQTPDIMEKARELFNKLIYPLIDERINDEQAIDLIAAALAGARAVPDAWRNELAARAMQALITKSSGQDSIGGAKGVPLIAEYAYEYADAMLAAAPNPPIAAGGK